MLNRKTLRHPILGVIGFLAAALPGFADYSSTVTSLNPVGYWRLNETTQPPAGDVAANLGTLGVPATGYYLNGATHPVPGIPGGGTDTAANMPNLNGGSGGLARLRVPYMPELNANAPFSVEFWAKPAITTAIACPAASVDFNITPRKGWLFYQGNSALSDGNGWYFRVCRPDTAVSIATDIILDPAQWYHVVGVYDGVNIILYVNGAQAATAPLGGAYAPVGNTIPLTFGARADGAAGNYGWGGDMDEPAYYGVALSAAQVLAHYQAGSNPTPPTPYQQVVTADAPLGYWRLNEPAYVVPDPGTLPVAVNIGTVGALANGRYSVYAQPGAAPAPFTGFGAGNYACGMNAADTPTSIVLGNPAELNFTGQITMMAWVKPLATDGLRNIIAHGHQTSPNNAEVGLRINAGSYQAWTWGSGDFTASYPIPAGDIGNWVFLAGTYDGTAWHLYRNGVEVASTPGTTGAILVSDVGWAIGARGDGSERFFKGSIDEVALFTSALSAAQILQLYNSANVPAFITTQPQPPVGNVYEGMTVSFNVAAGGVAPLSYQWTRNGANLSGKTATNLTLVNLTTADSGNYAVVVTNTYGSVTSSIIALNVQAGPPVIFQPPQSLTKYVGGSPSFQVVAGGSVPLAYQWKFGTTVLAGQTNPSLQLVNVQPADAGTYTVQVSNSYGTTNLDATLTLVQPDNYAAAVMANRPRAFWRLNETSGTVVKDWSGSYDGTYVGFVTNNVPGVQPPTYLGYESANTGYEFSGGRAYVETPPLGFTNNTFTYAFWAKPLNPQVTGVPFMFAGCGTGGGCALNLDNTDDLRYHFEDNSNTGWWVSTGLKIAWDAWNYIVLVIDPTSATFYLDKGDGNGLQTAVVAAAHRPVAFNLPSYIAREMRDMRYFKGPMDEVSIFDRALSASEVRSLHAIAMSGPQAPTIARQPAPTTRYVGSTASFSVEAVGVPPLAYQWRANGTPITGATTSSLTLPNVQLAQNGVGYSVTVTTSAGSVTSASAALTVLSPPAGYAAALLSYGPVAYWGLNETVGSTTAFDYVGGFDGVDQGGVTHGVPGPRSPAFTGFSAANNAAQFDGASGSILTSPAMGLNTNTVTITCWVKRNGTQIDFAGLVFTRGATVHGLDMKPDGELRYHWNNARYDWSSGLITPDGQWAFVALVVEPTKATMYMDAGSGLVSAVDNVAHVPVTFDQIRLGIDPTARFFNGDLDEAAVFNRALSPGEIATLHANAVYGTTTPPFVTLQPVSQTGVVGSTVTVPAAVSGSMPITYQWKKDGVDVPGATSAALSLPSAYYTDSGSYVLWATNVAGYTSTAAAVVTVLPPPSYANQTNGLVLHLKFENDVQDSSGRANHGTPMGSISYVSGRFGQALRYFTDPDLGQYNYVTLGMPPDLQFTNGVSFSVAFWIKFTGSPGDLPFLCNNTFSYGGQGLTLAPSYQQGAWSWYINDALAADWAGIGLYAPQQNTLNNGAWHHLVYTFDRTGNATVYRNGVMENQRSIAAGAAWNLDTGMALLIGQAGGVYGEKAAFEMDDMGIWRRALNAYEAESVYAAAQNGVSFDTVGPVNVYVNQVGSNIDVSWQGGTLLQSTTVNGTYTPVPGAAAPFYRTTATGSAMFFKVGN